MLKNISKIFVAGIAIVALQPLYSMEIYTVKSGDYLYKIAKSHSVTDISTGELTDSIKGINKSEVPGIVDNRIKVGEKLAIPTTKDEVEDGLTLVRNQMMQGSYNASSISQTPKVIQQGSNALKTDSAKLGDNAMISSHPTAVPVNTESSQVASQQNTIPNMMPNNDTQVVAYNNLSGINDQNIQENQSINGTSESSTFSSIVKLIFILIVLLGAFILGKRFWDSRNSRKEQELEILSKKKRDHLMSRISPVVSDSDFYKSDVETHGPQEEFDFFDGSQKASQSRNKSNIVNNLNTQENLNFDKELNGSNVDTNETMEESVESVKTILDEEIENTTALGSNDSAVKTSKGMVFETASDDSFKKSENLVEEIDSSAYQENEIQYIKELVDQYLDSEKYVEASITVQDSLEKNPNNIELRSMLLEIYARADDQIAFDGEVHLIKSKNIVSMFDPLHQKIAKLKDKYFE